jgi:tetratricopeptide (TPR) repeat protein
VTPGSRPWVVRSLRDWTLGVRQGMALVTYRSSIDRELVLRELTVQFEINDEKVERLECGECTAENFVARVAKSEADVLFVLGPDRLLFGENGDRSPFWVNFHRETLVAHPGVQIWWMLPNAAIRFGQQLPDLSRFFLFREDLTDEVRIETSASLELQISPRDSRPGDPSRARDLIERALRAAASPNANPARVWLELGIPAIDEFLRSGQLIEGSEALRQLTGLVGLPEEALNRESDPNVPGEIGIALLALSGLYRELGRREDALAAAENAVRFSRQLAEQRPSDFSLFDLAASLNNLAAMLGDRGRREEALPQAEEAARICRQLAQQHPDAFRPFLAVSLNTLAAMLIYLGRREEGLSEAEEAVRIYRQLAQQHPDAFVPDLARSLNNLAVWLNDAGRPEEALAGVEEAVRIYRRLAQQRPDAFVPDLANSLAVFGIIIEHDRPGEALAALEEALRLLTPFFLKVPMAHVSPIEAISGAYLRAAEAANIPPDTTLLDSVIPIVKSFYPPLDDVPIDS